MKDKRYKYIEDLVEDYLHFATERIEIPLTISAAKEKQVALLDEITGDLIKKGDAEDIYKIYTQVKKAEERLLEIEIESAEVENIFKEFLAFLQGNQLAYERKDEIEKQKITYLFWLEDDMIRCNR